MKTGFDIIFEVKKIQSFNDTCGALPVNLITVQKVTACGVNLIYAAHAKACVVFVCKKTGGYYETKQLLRQFCGILFIFLDFVLAGAMYISLSRNIAAKHDEIIMIMIATYTFCKIAIAVRKAIKQHKKPSLLLSAIRSISYAEVAASVLTVQCDVPDEKSVDKFIFLAYHITVVYNSVTRKDRQWVKLNRQH